MSTNVDTLGSRPRRVPDAELQAAARVGRRITESQRQRLAGGQLVVIRWECTATSRDVEMQMRLAAVARVPAETNALPLADSIAQLHQCAAVGQMGITRHGPVLVLHVHTILVTELVVTIEIRLLDTNYRAGAQREYVGADRHCHADGVTLD